ncbi:MAG TPA: hypothetical protein VJ599_05910 [Nitrososphaeraceae archaeon]|nr:hypothetical protein [Nitrososphaeraceae archaeon]
MDKNNCSDSLSMPILKKITNKKVVLSSVIVGVGVLFLVTIYAVSPLGQLSAQQMVMNGNFSKLETVPRINGSINVGQEIKNFFNENTKVAFNTAAETALQQVPNGKVLGGHIGVTQGYLTYTFFVIEPTGEIGHKVIVDAGNGKVLHSSEGFPLSSFASSWKGHGQEQWQGFHGPWKPMFGGSWLGQFVR